MATTVSGSVCRKVVTSLQAIVKNSDVGYRQGRAATQRPTSTLFIGGRRYQTLHKTATRSGGLLHYGAATTRGASQREGICCREAVMALLVVVVNIKSSLQRPRCKRNCWKRATNPRWTSPKCHTNDRTKRRCHAPPSSIIIITFARRPATTQPREHS